MRKEDHVMRNTGLFVGVLLFVSIFGFIGHPKSGNSSVISSSVCKNLSFPSICPRYSSSIVIPQPPNLFSKNGKLSTDMTYFNRDDEKETIFCYMSSYSSSGLQSPTLRLYPNDTLDITLRNCFSEGYTTISSVPMLLNTSHPCGSTFLTKTSTNLHFHGFVVPAICHIDLVVSNVINYNEEYRIRFTIPDIPTQRPGLYWYHPHIHKTTDTTVRGGASGAVIIEGIENIQPLVGGLPEQVLIFRDTTRPGIFSMNYVSIITAANKAGKTPSFPTLTVRPNEKQFWRILNAASGTFFYFQLEYHGIIQSFDVVSVDGFPLYLKDDENGKHPERNLYTTNALLIAPASRYELIIKTPKFGDIAYLKSKISNIDGIRHGSEGILFQLLPSLTAPLAEVVIPMAKKENIQRYSLLQNREWKEIKAEKPEKTRFFYSINLLIVLPVSFYFT
jgi:hypothetical protein